MQYNIEIRASDGRILNGKLFEHGAATKTLVIAGATAVPARFYASFATWLCQFAVNIITFDYRGTGAGSSLAHDRATKLDWLNLDIPAAIKYAKGNFAELPVILLGHSVGGQGLKTVTPIDDLSGIITVCCSSGYIYQSRNRLKNLALLKLYLPLSIMIFGYARLSQFGLGCDLAPGIARDFTRWCSKRGYLNGDEALKARLKITYPVEIDIPTLKVSASDDPFATAANQLDLWRFYAFSNENHYEAKPVDGRPIGHLNFFKKHNETHWYRLKEWLESVD